MLIKCIRNLLTPAFIFPDRAKSGLFSGFRFSFVSREGVQIKGNGSLRSILYSNDGKENLN